MKAHTLIASHSIIACILAVALSSCGRPSVPLTQIQVGKNIREGPVSFTIDSVTPSSSGFQYSIQGPGKKSQTELRQFVVKGTLKNEGTGAFHISRAAMIGISGRIVDRSVEVLSVPMSDLMQGLDIAPGSEQRFESEVSSLGQTELRFYWQFEPWSETTARRLYSLSVPKK